MKIWKQFLTLTLALCLVMSVTVFAAAGDPGTIQTITTEELTGVSLNGGAGVNDGDVKFDLTYTKATSGSMYLILVLEGDGEIPTEDNILYVNQATATGSTVTFQNVYPSAIKDGKIYVVGTDTELTCLGTIVANLADFILGDVNGDGVVNIDDVLECLNLCFVTPTEEELKKADIDENRSINIDDVLLCLDLCF